ncbi:MAG: type II secretion system F family protein [Bacteroidota bacterium]|nr:type II secretion system F family protein [Bacteroidota bacterium]
MPIEIKNIQSIKKKQQDSVPQNTVLTKVVGLLNKDIRLWGKKLKDRKKEGFYSELHVLLSSGIDIRTALDIVVEEQKSEEDRKLFTAIKTDVVGGAGLSDAIFKTGNFSTYEYYSLRIGEESGRIKDVLADLTLFYSKKIKQQRQITSALTYPVMVLITAILAVQFMLTFIVPMFMDVFKRFNGKIPALTQAIISASQFMRSYSWLLLLIFVSVVVMLISIRREEYFRKWSSALMLKLPLFGDIVQKIYLSRYCQSMTLLLGAKTPMLRSLGLVRQMIGFYPFEKAIEVMEDDILHGKLLHQSMARFSFFDTRIISLVRVAEEVNQLENIFSKLNAQYNDELEHRIGMLSSLLEPIMIIIVGGLVAVILIAMYMPLFQLSSSVY